MNQFFNVIHKNFQALFIQSTVSQGKRRSSMVSVSAWCLEDRDSNLGGGSFSITLNFGSRYFFDWAVFIFWRWAPTCQGTGMSNKCSGWADRSICKILFSASLSPSTSADWPRSHKRLLSSMQADKIVYQQSLRSSKWASYVQVELSWYCPDPCSRLPELFNNKA